MKTLVWVILILVAILWAIIGSDSFNSYSSIEETTCSDVQKNAKGTELKNAFGGTFEVLDVRNSKEISRSKDKLVCLGDLRLDNGDSDSKLRMELTFDDNQFWYRYEVQ